ncbi:DMT family transporter [Nocardioides korecus]
MWIGVLVAACAAGGFAVSTSLQHHANARLAGAVAMGRDARPAGLVRQPWWVFGQLVAFASFALHAWALGIGLLVVVQPIVVSGIVLAVPVRAALDRRRPRRSELATVAVTAAGLATFLVSGRPSAPVGPVRPDQALALLFVGAGLVATAVAAWAARGRAGVTRAGAYGLASGVLFGLTAALVKLVAVAVAAGHPTSAWGVAGVVATSWAAWLVAPVGIAGVVLNQWAYRAGRLSASMPLLNVVDVLVAVGFGVLVLGETPAHGPLDLLGELLGAVLVTLGLRRLARTEPDPLPIETGRVSLVPAESGA